MVVQERLVLEVLLVHADDGPNAVVGVDVDELANRAALGRAPALWNFEGAQPEALALVREQQEDVVRVADVEVFNEVVLALAGPAHANAAATLRAVRVDGRTLGEALVRDGDDDVLPLDQVFDDDVVAAGIVNLGAALIVEPVFDLQELFLDDLHPAVTAAEDVLEPLNFLQNVLVFTDDFLALQPCETAQAKAQDRVRLFFGEPMTLFGLLHDVVVVIAEELLNSVLLLVRLDRGSTRHVDLVQVRVAQCVRVAAFAQILAGRAGVRGVADNGDDGVEVVERQGEPLQNVRPVLSLLQVVFGTADDDLVAVVHVVPDGIL